MSLANVFLTSGCSRGGHVYAESAMSAGVGGREIPFFPFTYQLQWSTRKKYSGI